jgi:hypothetical protein
MKVDSNSCTTDAIRLISRKTKTIPIAVSTMAVSNMETSLVWYRLKADAGKTTEIVTERRFTFHRVDAGDPPGPNRGRMPASIPDRPHP